MTVYKEDVHKLYIVNKQLPATSPCRHSLCRFFLLISIMI